MTGQLWSAPTPATDRLPDQQRAADADLVRHAQAGDRAAFGVLFDRHAPHAYALARGLSGDQAEVEDLVQAAFLQALGALRGLRNAEAFGPWLSRIVVNLARDAGRRRARMPQAELSATVAETYPDAGRWGSPEAMALAAEEQYAVQVALSRLAPSQRAALAMREIGGLSSAEIASALGARATRIDALLFRARARFRAEYGKALGAAPSQTAGCRQVRGALVALMAGQIGTEERARVLAHVDHCQVCAAAIQVQREARRLAACIPLALPAGLRELVLRTAARLPNPGLTGSIPGVPVHFSPPVALGAPLLALPGAPVGGPATAGAGAGGAALVASGSGPVVSTGSALLTKAAAFAVAGLVLGGMAAGHPGPGSGATAQRRGAIGDANRHASAVLGASRTDLCRIDCPAHRPAGTTLPPLAQLLARATVSRVLLRPVDIPHPASTYPGAASLRPASGAPPSSALPVHSHPLRPDDGAPAASLAALPPQDLAPPSVSPYVPRLAPFPPSDTQPEALSPPPAPSQALAHGATTAIPALAAAPRPTALPTATAQTATARAVPATATAMARTVIAPANPALAGTPTATIAVAPTPTSTIDPSPTSRPTAHPTATVTSRGLVSPVPRPAILATATVIPTLPPVPTATRVRPPTATATAIPPAVASPTLVASTPTPSSPSASPTPIPTPSPSPTRIPSATPAHASSVAAGHALGPGSTGTATPRPRPTPASRTPTPTRTPTPIRTPALVAHSPTSTPTPTPGPARPATASATRSPSPTPQPATPAPSATRTPTPPHTPEPIATATPSPSSTAFPTATAILVPSSTPTSTVTLTATPLPWTPAPTDIPTATPTFNPTGMGPVTAPAATLTPGLPPVIVNLAPSLTPTATPSQTPAPLLATPTP